MPIRAVYSQVNLARFALEGWRVLEMASVTSQLELKMRTGVLAGLESGYSLEAPVKDVIYRALLPDQHGAHRESDCDQAMRGWIPLYN